MKTQRMLLIAVVVGLPAIAGCPKMIKVDVREFAAPVHSPPCRPTTGAPEVDTGYYVLLQYDVEVGGVFVQEDPQTEQKIEHWFLYEEGLSGHTAYAWPTGGKDPVTTQFRFLEEPDTLQEAIAFQPSSHSNITYLISRPADQGDSW